MSLDMLIDTLVSDSMVSTGANLRWMEKSQGFARAGSVLIASTRMPEWTPEEEAFLIANLGRLGCEGVAEALGRTASAVQIHYKRKGFPAPSREPGYVSANKAGEMLGVESHKVCGWIDMGIMPGETLEWSQQGYRRISLVQLKMWLIRPETWIYINAKRIHQSSLRRLVELAQAKWADEWWSMRQAAEYHGCETTDILRQIELGKLAGVRAVNLSGRHTDQVWSYWYTRKSEVMRIRIYKGKGSNAFVDYWSPRADAFLLRARAQGMTCKVIARLMKWKLKKVEYRLRLLKNSISEQETGVK